MTGVRGVCLYDYVNSVKQVLGVEEVYYICRRGLYDGIGIQKIDLQIRSCYGAFELS